MDINRISSIEELIERMQLEAPVRLSKGDEAMPSTRLPVTVRKLRQARLKRRIERSRILGGTRRSGATHWKARQKAKRLLKQKPWFKREKAKHKQARLADPPRRYREILRTQWKRKLKDKPELLAEVMSVKEYVWLMEQVPDRLYELADDVITVNKYRNLPAKVEDGTWITTSYPNTNNSRIIDTYHTLVRLDSSKSYSLDNVIVYDNYTKLVYYSCTMN